ncbi:hypothetical protein MESS2_p120022 [Mesorhizobium metallidurans STM 2683]|uniref:Tn3 transposase DDE domain-containing protein n=1 Tax=Mesorhizobium metallidurans STM 2683 TaxID=1297569 RepID=M5FC05_9HYPH|nr:hypothetical protein MESS2_p120022 [Mesorhizobium metallidurans STM 2683]
MHWNTVYLDCAVTQMKRAGRNIPDPAAPRVSASARWVIRTPARFRPRCWSKKSARR